MKKYFIAILSFLLISSTLFAQIPNAGFENWTAGNPDDWATLNFLYHDISASTAAHSGTNSAKAEIVTYNGNPAGILFQSGSTATGFPVSQRHASVSGYYQFNSVDGDRLAMNIVMYHGTQAGGTVIGTSVQPIITSSTVDTWQQFTTQIVYIHPDDADTCVINFVILGPTSTDYHLGTYALLDDLTLDAASSVKETSQPVTYTLSQNYPNPFNPSTNIAFSLPTSAFVSLKIFDLTGNEVTTLVSKELEAGNHIQQWNAASIPSGIYFYRLNATPQQNGRTINGGFTETRKLTLIK